MKTTITKELRERIESAIIAECAAIDREMHFDQMLDECYSFDSVGGPFAHMSPSSVLKEMDPVAYRCGVNDYADSQDWVEVGGYTYDRKEAEEAIETLLDEIREELQDKEEELADAETDGTSEEGKRVMQFRIDNLNRDIDAVESYSL